MTRYFLCTLALAFVLGLVLALVAFGDTGSPTTTTETGTEPPPTTTETDPADAREIRRLHRKLRVEHRHYVGARRRALQLTRTLAHRSSTREAIELACVVYGSCDTLWRRAVCESRLDPYARNPSGAAGLYQFLPSTWRSTPFGGFSIWSPAAQALAAGWMHAHGRGGEWTCR